MFAFHADTVNQDIWSDQIGLTYDSAESAFRGAIDYCVNNKIDLAKTRINVFKV